MHLLIVNVLPEDNPAAQAAIQTFARTVTGTEQKLGCKEKLDARPLTE